MPSSHDETPQNLLRPQKPNDWFIYHIFYIAAQSRTLDEAAKQTGFTGPYISKMIDKLENALEMKLIIRGVNCLELTKAGKEIYTYLQEANVSFDKITHYAERSKSGYTETPLNIAAPVLLSATIITPFMVEFSEKHPDVCFYLNDYKYYEIDELYEADCAVIFGEPKRQHYCADYLFTNKMGIYASTEYLKKHGTPETLDELLENYDIISRQQHVKMSTPKSRWIRPFLNNHENQSIISKSIRFISDNVLNHKGFGILSNAYTLAYPVEKMPFKETNNAIEEDVHFVYPREHKNYKAIIAFREFLLEITRPLR